MTIAKCVRVDEDLVSVKSVPGGVRRAIDSVRIVHARSEASYKGVPEMESLIYLWFELNRLEWRERIVG
jgi:hypothetical protein